jgi:hypothetical protein
VPTTAALLDRYAQPFDARYIADHGVASALGLWLLLALVAPATSGSARDRLEGALGTDADDAAARATALLATPHPAVHAAVALWARRAFLDTPFASWAEGLPATVEQGDMPSQAAADAWAERNTFGLVARFPVEITSITAIVLASALATDVAWAQPFVTAPAAELGGPFGGSITVALRAHHEHTRAFVETEAAGLVAVHAADAVTGLRVLSVIAAPDVAPGRVHVAARAVAAMLGGDPAAPARPVDLFDLPVGEGHAWTLTEDEREVRELGDGDRTQRITTFLPAWSAHSDHDLLDAPGVPDVLPALDGFLLPKHRPAELEVRQSAVAECTRHGFRAAAVTAMAVRLGSALPPPRRVRHREAIVRFARPYAVLAVAQDEAPDEERGWGTRSLGVPDWDGLPVFGAWVGRPDDTEPDGTEPLGTEPDATRSNPTDTPAPTVAPTVRGRRWWIRRPRRPR